LYILEYSLQTFEYTGRINYALFETFLCKIFFVNFDNQLIESPQNNHIFMSFISRYLLRRNEYAHCHRSSIFKKHERSFVQYIHHDARVTKISRLPFKKIGKKRFKLLGHHDRYSIDNAALFMLNMFPIKIEKKLEYFIFIYQRLIIIFRQNGKQSWTSLSLNNAT
jgi:hypothetical protein